MAARTENQAAKPSPVRSQARPRRAAIVSTTTP